MADEITTERPWNAPQPNPFGGAEPTQSNESSPVPDLGGSPAPTNPAPTVLSSKPARDKTIDNRAKLSDFGDSLAEAQETAKKLQEGFADFNANNTETTPKEETPLDVGEETDDGFDDTRDAIEQGNIDIDAELVEIESMLNLRAEALDTANSALIDSIKQTYERRRNELRKINEATLAGLTTLGIRAGRQRYAGEIQSGILSSEERAGVQRITELDNEELALIAQANAANDEKQFAILETSMNKLQEARREKLDLIRDLNTLALQEETNARDRMRFNMETDEFDRARSSDIAETIASDVLNNLTGDTELDNQSLQDIADAKDIDVDVLRSTLIDLQSELNSVNGQIITSTDASGNVTVSLVDKDSGKLINQTGLGAVGKPASGDTTFDPRLLALESTLLASRDDNGYVPLEQYNNLRRTADISASQFDDRFGGLLNDKDRVTSGVDKEEVADMYFSADNVNQLAQAGLDSRGLEEAIAELRSTKSVEIDVSEEGADEPKWKKIMLTDTQIEDIIKTMEGLSPTEEGFNPKKNIVSHTDSFFSQFFNNIK